MKSAGGDCAASKIETSKAIDFCGCDVTAIDVNAALGADDIASGINGSTVDLEWAGCLNSTTDIGSTSALALAVDTKIDGIMGEVYIGCRQRRFGKTEAQVEEEENK